MKYRKKPVVIDAVQYDGNFRSLDCFSINEVSHFIVSKDSEGNQCIKIPTLEGEMTASVGDYIIRGVKGEYYPCKPDVFEQTYEKVEDGGTPTFPFWGDVPTRIPITNNDTVPYYTICQCNPANGGSGVCGCTMGQTMVPNPGMGVFAPNVVNKSTSDSTITSNGTN